MTTNMTLRIPADLASLVDQAAADDGLNRHAFIIALLREAVERDDGLSPSLVLGFVELASSEIDSDIDCPECDQPLERPHIGFVAGSRRPLTFGPVCYRCATTDA